MIDPETTPIMNRLFDEAAAVIHRAYPSLTAEKREEIEQGMADLKETTSAEREAMAAQCNEDGLAAMRARIVAQGMVIALSPGNDLNNLSIPLTSLFCTVIRLILRAEQEEPLPFSATDFMPYFLNLSIAFLTEAMGSNATPRQVIELLDRIGAAVRHAQFLYSAR